MTRDEIVRSLSERWRFSIAEDSSLWSDVGAALQERDAAHEIALKKARTDALNAAARQADAAAENYLGSMGRANKEHDHTAERLSWASMDACRYVASRIRALLEEAGK